jgi:hypothetical protein
VYLNGSLPITVYGEIAEAGTIDVTATATGLTAGTVAIPAYVNTAPASLKISSTSGTTSGTPYTIYTVQLEDTNGNPITTGTNASDALSISASSDVKLLTVSNGLPTSTAIPGTPTLTDGSYTFAAENTSIGSPNPTTITVKDTVLGFTQTASYTYRVGSPADAVITSPSVSSYVEPGTNTTVSAQIEDANGNDVSMANQQVAFWFTTNGAGATLPNGLNEVGTGYEYLAETNTSGVASVNISVPASASEGSFFQMEAGLAGATSGSQSPTVTVEPAANYATQMAFTGGTFTSPVTAGSTAETGQGIELKNSVGDQVGTNDVLQYATSNSAVLPLPNGQGTDTVTAASGMATLPTLTAGLAGTATLTITDLSNPTVHPISETVTVIPGAPAKGTFYYNGKPVGSSNEVSATANEPVTLTLYNTDAAGDPVPVTTTEAAGASSATFNLTDGTEGGGFRLSPSGANVTSVTIPVGQESVTVYYVNATSGSYDAMAASLAAPTVSVGSFTEAGSTAPYTYTSTVTVTNASGSGVTGLTASDFTVTVGGTALTAAGSTPAAGQYTVTAGSTAGQYTLTIYESSATDTSSVSVAVDGGTGSGTL